MVQIIIINYRPTIADSSGRAVKGVSLRPLGCWHCGFESGREHGCLCLVSVVCWQVEVSASADQSSRGVPWSVMCLIESDREALVMMRPWATRGRRTIKENRITINHVYKQTWITPNSHSSQNSLLPTLR